jgi:Spy/CpxP family protein refolding chaperone
MTRGHRHTSHYLHYLLRHRQAIGLTDEQVAKLKVLQLDFDRTRIRTGAEIKVASRELMALVQDDKADLPSIEAKVKQRADFVVALHMAAIKAKREAMAVLTPEQREKAKAEREKMMQHRRDCRMGHRAAHASLSPERDAAPSEGEPVQEDHQEFPGSRWAGLATAPEEQDALVSSAP